MFIKKRRGGKEPLDRIAIFYLGLKFFSALHFTYPIFYEFASQAITPLQVGIFFSVIGICGFIAEVPTGIFADKWSRKLSGLFGMTLATIAPLIVFLGHDFSAYIVAAVFYGIGRAFLSGSVESMVYDHKNITDSTYRRVNALEITFGQAGILIGAAFGGVFFSVSHGLPFIAEVVAGVICLVLLVCMKEHRKEGYVKPVATHTQHFIQSFKYLFATPYLRVLVLFGVIFSVMLGMCIQFVHEATMIEHGFQAETRGVLISSAGAAALVILNVFLLKVLKSDTVRLIYMGYGAVAAYMLMSISHIPLFLLGYLLWTCLNATSSFVRVMLQAHIPSSHRSTIHSSFKTLAIMIGVVGSTGTGLLVQWAHTPRAAYLLFCVIALTVLLPCVIWLVRSGRTRVPYIDFIKE